MWWNIMIPGRTNFFSKETHGHSSLCGFGQCGSVPNSLSMWNVPTTFSFWTWKAKTWRVRFHQSAHLPHCLFSPLSSVKPPRWGSWEESHEERYHQIEPLLSAIHSPLAAMWNVFTYQTVLSTSSVPRAVPVTGEGTEVGETQAQPSQLLSHVNRWW